MKGKIGRKLILRRSQRGDTLISVAMSVAAISLVIVLSYFLVSRGISLNQQAKEREQVRNLVQSQIEGIKNLAFKGGTEATQDPFYTYAEAGDAAGGERRFFCLNTDGLIVTYQFAGSPLAPRRDATTEELEFYTTGDYRKMVDLAGVVGNLPLTEVKCEAFSILDATNLEIVITYEKYKQVAGQPPPGIEQNLFTVTATWEGADGGKEENMVVATRLHPLSPSSP